MFRTLIKLTIIFSVAVSFNAFSQSDYPTRPLRIIVGYAPGASTDTVTRIIADKLSITLGQPVIVENRVGAAGLIAAQAVAHATPDGYTLLACNPELVGIVPALYKNPPYNAIKDFTYIGLLSRNSGWIVVVNPQTSIKNVNDLIRVAKTTDKLISYGSYGIGSLPHLNFEALKAKLNIDMVHIPYRGGALSFQAAMAGEVQIVSGTSFIDLIRSGKLRAIAIGGDKRSPLLPDIPTFSELGYGDQIFGELYVGLAAPAGTPLLVVNKISAELKKIISMPDVIERIGKFSDATYVTPQEFNEIVRRDVNYFGPIVRSLGLNVQ